MTYTPCSKRQFKISLVNPFLRNYKEYVHLLKHLLQRLGHQSTLELWQSAIRNYKDEFLKKILSTGWQKSEEDKTEKIETQISGVYKKHFKSPVDGVSAKDAKQLIDQTPPLSQIREHFASLNMERSITTFEALHLAFDGLASLIESLLGSYGKEGELIAYDFLKITRVSMAQGKTKDFAQFVSDNITFLTSTEPNIFTAGLDVAVIKSSDKELIIHVKECEWARYFRTHHSQVDYLMACSTDEAFAQACNEKIRMQRTSTIMEGGKICDFRHYITE